MTTPIRFRRGFGLGVRSSDITQGTLLAAENVAMDEVGVIKKATGHDIVSLVRSGDPTDLIPADDTRAIWHRGPELVLETKAELYSRQVCAQGAAGSQTAGTATAGEITTALQVLEDRADRNRQITVPLPGDLASTALRVRANRDPEVVSAEMTGFAGPVNTVTMVVAPDAVNPNVLRWTATQSLNATTATGLLQSANGASPLQRAPGIANIKAILSSREEFVISYVSNFNITRGTLVADTLELTDQDPLTFTQSTTLLDELRGAPAQSWATLRDNAIAGFLTNGTYRVYRVDALASVRDFAVSNPPPDGDSYLTDHSAGLFPTPGPFGAVWLSAADNTLNMADLDVVGATVNAEASAPGVLSSSSTARKTVAIVEASEFAVEWLAGWRQTNSPTIPALGWDTAGTTIRVSDLEGADLLLDTATGSQVTYVMRREDTGERLTNNQPMGALVAVVDSQFVVSGDEVVGALIDGGRLFQLSWERSFDTPVVFVRFTDAAALAQSANRFVFAYWTSTTDLEIRVLSSYDDASPETSTATAAAVYALGNPLACAVLLENGFGEDADVRVHSWLADGTVFSVTLEGVSDTLTDPRTDAFLEVPAFAAATPGNPVVPPRSIFGIEYSSGSTEIWEVNTDLFVRVSPPLVVLAGGDWVLRGPWTRTRARQTVVRNYSVNNVVSCDAATVVNSEGDVCTFVAQEVATLGAVVDIVSTHTESSETIDPVGLRPRASTYDANRAVVTYELPTRELVTTIWSPGSSLSFASFGAFVDPSRAWDQTATRHETSPVSVIAWDVDGGGGTLNIRVVPETGTPVTYVRVHGLVATDAAIFAAPIAGTIIRIAWAVSGATVGVDGFNTGIDEVDTATGVVVAQFQRIVNISQDPFAIAVGALDSTTAAVWVETDEGTNRLLRVYDVTVGDEILRRAERRSALVSQLQILSGQIVGAFSLLGGEFFDTKIFRNGVFLKAHVTGEIVGRLAVGLSENFRERLLRTPHTGLNLDPTGAIVLGWQLSTVDPLTDSSPVTALLRWDPNAGPASPAVIDGVAVNAHGGSPRMYAGQVVGEHDWHELPEASGDLIEVALAGVTSAGTYTVAITWERTDETGQLYRSAPTFYPTITVAASSAISVPHFSLTQTEHTNVRLVFWRSIANGVELHRELDGLAVFGTDSVILTLALVLTDEVLQQREILDQFVGDGGVLFSVPTSVTDFTAAVNSRIWSRDPAADQRVRYTVASRDFGLGAVFGLHWPGELVLRHNGPGEVTAVAELDGRVVIMTGTSASVVSGDGPTETGQGSYAVPALLALDIGCGGQSAIASTPDGLIYGTPPPERDCDPGLAPRLLSRGLTVLRVGEPLDAAYAAGARGDIVVYSESTGDVICADTVNAAIFRWNRDTQRWHRGTRWTTRDMSSNPSGRVVILTADGRVLLECADRFDDGGIGYVTIFARTPWIYSEPGNPWGAGSLSIVHTFGRVVTDHSHKLVVRHDYDETVVSSVAVAATTANRFYEYRPNGQPMASTSIEVTDGGELVNTLVLEGLTIDITSSAARGADQVPEDQVFTLDT